MGLRLQLRRQQAQAGDVVLLYVDEADFLNVPYLTRMWARQGADLRVEAPGKVKRRCVSGARNACTGHLLAWVSQTKKTQDLLELIHLVEQTYKAWAQTPVGSSRPGRQVVLVLDNGPSHTSRATLKALSERSDWLSVEWLPKFSPELNEIERDWRVLKSRYLGNRSYLHEWDLERCILEAIAHLNQERSGCVGETGDPRREGVLPQERGDSAECNPT